jgi:hypothetical protein
MLSAATPPASDALVVSLKLLPDGGVVPGHAELRGGLIRMRLSLPPDAGLAGCFSRDGRAAIEGALARLKDVSGVMVMVDYEARLPKLVLRQCRATVGSGPDGAELVSLRFRECVGDALSLFRQEWLPEGAVAEEAPQGDADALTDLLLPLFNLRQYLSDFPLEQVAADLDRLNRAIDGILQQINLIAEGYYARREATRGPAPSRVGVDGVTSRLMTDAVEASRRWGALPTGRTTLTYHDEHATGATRLPGASGG